MSNGRSGAMTDRLLAAIRQTPGYTSYWYAQRLGLDVSATASRLHVLATQHRVTRERIFVRGREAWHYRVPEPGQVGL